MSLVNKIGDLYHKHVYRHLTSVTRVTDVTDFAFTDVALLPVAYIHEFFLGMGSYLTYRYISKTSETDAVEFLGEVAFGFGVGIAAATIASFGNMFRTSIEEKLSLEPAEVKTEMEVKYSIEMLNSLADSPKLEHDELVEEVNLAIDSFVEKTEGYKVRHAKKVKKSVFGNILKRSGIGGLLNPFIHEVVVFIPERQETYAHEKAHQVGYIKEVEAEFIGYAAMKESGNRSLEYLAFRQRLDMAMTAKERENLEFLGLNQRTLQEIHSFHRSIEMDWEGLSKYRKFKMKYSRKLRNLFLKSSGQGSIAQAYIGKPLKLISAYDPPKNS